MDGKWKMIFLKKTGKYDAFCIFGKDDICFSYKHENTFSPKKAKATFSWKIQLKMTFPASLKKMILIPEKMILAF